MPGDPRFDLASWLPSLEAEGGPAPEEILGSPAPELAALLAGYFCSHAGLPPIPEAPHVRELQLRQARTALPWAARELGLPPPGDDRDPLHLQRFATLAHRMDRLQSLRRGRTTVTCWSCCAAGACG